MTENFSHLDKVMLPSRDNIPPEIPGIIDGTMTVHPEPGGNVSFRVVIGIDDGQTAKRDLLELIIGPSYIGNLSRALTGQDISIAGGSDPVPSFPCHIGFCRNAISSAA